MGPDRRSNTDRAILSHGAFAGRPSCKIHSLLRLEQGMLRKRVMDIGPEIYKFHDYGAGTGI